jgi:hypothetical protein
VKAETPRRERENPEGREKTPLLCNQSISCIVFLMLLWGEGHFFFNLSSPVSTALGNANKGEEGAAQIWHAGTEKARGEEKRSNDSSKGGRTTDTRER